MKRSEKITTFNFVIRDDDLCFFSKPEHVTSAYAEVFAQNIPVSFSTIPMITLPNDAWLPRPLPTASDSGSFPISDNRELREYVTSNPLIEIMEHGYTHQTPSGTFEYAQKCDLSAQTIAGKKILEDTFGKPVTVFVAPHDSFSNQGILAIESAGLHIIRGKGMKNFLPRFSYMSALWKMIMFRLRFMMAGILLRKIPAYPHTLDLGFHREAFGIRIESDRESLFRALSFAHKTKGNFILVNHIHDFNEQKKQLMLELISEAKKLDARFIKASELF